MENPGSSNLLKGKMPGDVIQIDTDEETINTTIEPDEIDSTDSAQNLDEIDDQSENGKYDNSKSYWSILGDKKKDICRFKSKVAKVSTKDA